jgi:hypothetical protein
MEPKAVKPKAKAKSKPKGKPAKTGTSTALVPAEPIKRSARKPAVRFREEIAEIILDGLRRGQSLRAICKSKGMPDESTVRAGIVG